MEAGGVPDRQRRLGRGRGGAGLRHVSWVRVTLTPTGSRCEAVGIGHRIPVVRRIALTTASRLIAGGVPSVVVRDQVAPRPGAEPQPAPAAAAARAEG